MAKITLINTQNYARKKKLSRTTVWRRACNGEIDYYLLPGSKKRWFIEKEPSIFRVEQKMLNEILNVELV
ncbi:MAG: hypothetical protein WC220_00080 [Pedobacter sp.]|jgi:hypothetical protein